MSPAAREGILPSADAFRGQARSRSGGIGGVHADADAIADAAAVDCAVIGFPLTSDHADPERACPELGRRVGGLRAIHRPAARRPRRGSLPVSPGGRPGDRRTVEIPDRSDLHRAWPVHLRLLPVARHRITTRLLRANHPAGHQDARVDRLSEHRQGGGRSPQSPGAGPRQPLFGSAVEGSPDGLRRAAGRLGHALSSPPGPVPSSPPLIP